MICRIEASLVLTFYTKDKNNQQHFGLWQIGTMLSCESDSFTARSILEKLYAFFTEGERYALKVFLIVTYILQHIVQRWFKL